MPFSGRGAAADAGDNDHGSAVAAERRAAVGVVYDPGWGWQLLPAGQEKRRCQRRHDPQNFLRIFRLSVAPIQARGSAADSISGGNPTGWTSLAAAMRRMDTLRLFAISGDGWRRRESRPGPNQHHARFAPAAAAYGRNCSTDPLDAATSSMPVFAALRLKGGGMSHVTTWRWTSAWPPCPRWRVFPWSQRGGAGSTCGLAVERQRRRVAALCLCTCGRSPLWQDAFVAAVRVLHERGLAWAGPTAGSAAACVRESWRRCC